MPINSRAKGAAGEIEWRNVLREHGYEAERGQQHAGGADTPDVIHDMAVTTASGQRGVHFEVKRTETLRLWDAVEQAERDCGDRMPVVVHRPNRREWIVILRAEDFFNLAGG